MSISARVSVSGGCSPSEYDRKLRASRQTRRYPHWTNLQASSPAKYFCPKSSILVPSKKIEVHRFPPTLREIPRMVKVRATADIARPSISRKVSGTAAAKGTRFSREEDELLVKLKEKDNLSWSEIAKHFPERTRSSLQVRYSATLKHRRSRPRGIKQSGRAESILDAAPASSGLRRSLDSRVQTVDRRRDPSGSPINLPCRQRYGPPRSRRAVDRYGYSAA